MGKGDILVRLRPEFVTPGRLLKIARSALVLGAGIAAKCLARLSAELPVAGPSDKQIVGSSGSNPAAVSHTVCAWSKLPARTAHTPLPSHASADMAFAVVAPSNWANALSYCPHL